MVFCCFACGTHYNPLNPRTFHRFPKNEDLKIKWLEAIGKTNVYNNAVICSDHFDDDDFSENMYATRRRLRPNVVPSIKRERIFVVVEGDIDVSSLLGGSTTDMSTEENNFDDLNTCESRLPAKYMSGDITETNNISDITKSSLDLGDNLEKLENNHEISRSPCDEIVKYGYPSFVTEIQEVKYSDDTQQSKLSDSDENQCTNTPPNRKVFVKLPNKGTDYFTRKDFTSDQAWDKFLKAMTWARHERKILRQQSLRHKNRVADMKNLLLIYMRKDAEKNSS